MRRWKKKWEAAWDGDVTGADVKAALEELEVFFRDEDVHARATVSWGLCGNQMSSCIFFVRSV